LEVYGPEQLEHQARLVAGAAVILEKSPGRPLLDRFHHIGKELSAVHRWLIDQARQPEIVATDAEWFLDNAHIINQTIAEVAKDLPRGYHRELPKLTDGGRQVGFPRVYALALSLIAHTDSVLEENPIIHFVQSYQTVTPLTIGETWAVPIMLRVGLLENLYRLAQHLIRFLDERRQVSSLVHSLIECHEATDTEKLFDPGCLKPFPSR
jgi:cyclic beta-1,2-glucan synthetase